MSLSYLLTILVTLILTVYLIKKYSLSKYQVMIFVLLVLFWASIIVIRAYRKSYAANPPELGGLALGAASASVIASGYGFISIFARFGIFYLSDVFHSRKLLIGISSILVGLTSLWVVLEPNYLSLLLSSLALGIGASTLSLFNVFFAQTFDAKEAMKSVSILSVAPLLAEFTMSAFQANYTIVSQENYQFLWILSLGLSIISFIFLLFVKDNKAPERLMTKKSMVYLLKQKETYIYGGIAVLVSVVKFALSGSNMITYFQSPLVGMNAWMVAYSDFLFGIAQLVAGVLAGTVLVKFFELKKVLLFGVIIGLIFNGFLLVSTNNNLLFFGSILAGFGYGLTYNSLIGLTLQSVKVNLREMNMSIFQTFFAIGIFYGDYIYKIILRFVVNENESLLYHNVFLTIFGLSIVLVLLILLILKQKGGPTYEITDSI